MHIACGTAHAFRVFTPEGGGTRGELEHRGRERAGLRAAEMRTGYGGGWEIVLARYVADMGRHER